VRAVLVARKLSRLKNGAKTKVACLEEITETQARTLNKLSLVHVPVRVNPVLGN
jgi:hypothetical protein